MENNKNQEEMRREGFNNLYAPDFDTFQQKFSNSLTFRTVLRHPKLFLKKGLDLLLPLG